jgi:hypothetical protein
MTHRLAVIFLGAVTFSLTAGGVDWHQGVPEMVALAQEKPKQPVAQATEAEALVAAAADLATVQEIDRIFTRYVWIESGRFKGARTASLAINLLSTAPTISRPVPVKATAKRPGAADVPILLQRCDLRQFANTDAALQSLLETWEEFQFEPRFNLLLTKGTLKFATGIKLPKVKRQVKRAVDELIDVPEYTAKDGKRYTKAWSTKEVVETEEVDALGDRPNVVRQVSPHLPLEAVAFLIDQTHSQAPVVSLSYLVARGMRQVQDKGTLWADLYGGLYYRFRGIKKAKKGTDEDNYFAGLGVGSVADGIKAADVLNVQQQDARAAVFVSGVTGRPRRIDFLRTLSGHVARNYGFLSITQDLKRSSIDIDQHPLFNLDPFGRGKFDAKELIRETTNGLNEFVLFDGAGGLLDQAADDVASDSTIPPPYGNVLEPAIGCIRCHAGGRGWQTVTNDVIELTQKTKGNPGPLLDIFDDLGGAHRKGILGGKRDYTRDETLKRLAGLYSADPEQTMLPQARDAYTRAIQIATGQDEGENGVDLAQIRSTDLAEVFGRYFYRRLTAVDMLRDLGEVWDGQDAKAAGRRLQELTTKDVNAVQANTVWIYPLEGGQAIAIPEDPVIAALYRGIGIERSDYDLRYTFVAMRYAAKKAEGAQQK